MDAKTDRKPRTRIVSEIPPSDWDWVVGLFYADGCKFRDRSHYAVVFTLATSENLVLAKLLRILRSAGLSPSVYKKLGRRAVDIRTYSKNFFHLFPEKSSWYSPSVPLAYLAGLFDGDGHIARHGGGEKWVFSQAKYPHLAGQVRDIISDYGEVTLCTVHRESWLPISRVSVLRNARKQLKQNDFAFYCTRLASLNPLP